MAAATLAKLALGQKVKQVNQYASAPPAPAAPPATVAGVGTQAAKEAADKSPAAALAASAPTPAGAPDAKATPAAAIASAPAPSSPAAPPAAAGPPTLLTTPAASSWVGDPKDDPRDSTYYNNIAKNRSDTNIEESQLDTEERHRRAAHDTAAVQIAHQNDINTRTQRESNARSGLGTSTQGGNAIGEVEWNFAQANAANETDLQNWLDAAAITRQGLEQGYTVDEAGELGAAVIRKSQRDALLPPVAGAGKTPNANTTASAKLAGAIAAPKPGVATAQSGPPPDEHHWWDGTKWVETGPSPGPDYQWDGTRWTKTKPDTTIVPGPSAPVPAQYSQPNNPPAFASGPSPGPGYTWDGTRWNPPAAAAHPSGPSPGKGYTWNGTRWVPPKKKK